LLCSAQCGFPDHRRTASRRCSASMTWHTGDATAPTLTYRSGCRDAVMPSEMSARTLSVRSDSAAEPRAQGRARLRPRSPNEERVKRAHIQVRAQRK
jgi:hypothetical protein